MDIDRTGCVSEIWSLKTEKGEITVEELIPAETDERTLRRALDELRGILGECGNASEED